MSDNFKLALTEAVKEFFRTGILGGISSSIAVVISGIDTQAGSFYVNWNVIGLIFLVTLLTALQRSLDRFIHTWGKESGSKVQGLVGF